MFLRGVFLASLLAASGLLAGCAISDATEDDAAADESDLSGTASALAGSYAGGATITHLELTAGGTFAADLGTGAHLEGTFTAGPKTITFKSPSASAAAAKFLGRYRYETNGPSLVLSRADVQDTLGKIVPGPLGTCAAGSFTQAFADHIVATVPPVPGNTANDLAPASKRKIASFAGRTWTRGADGRWTSSPAILDGYRGDLYLGDPRRGAYDVVVHARTSRTITATSSAGELFRFVFFQGTFSAPLGAAEIAAPVVLDGKLSESPWGNFGSPPEPLTFRGPARFTDHCFSMLDAPVTATTNQVREVFATF